jgi:hypothetical protein
VKSFSEPQTIVLGIPNGELGSGYNVIVGENNTGKSTLLTSVRHLLSRERSVTIGQEARHNSGKPVLELVWKDDEGTECIEISPNVMSRKNYDAVCKELFFSDRAVLLEGSEDVHYIENFLEATEQKPLPIMGYGCGGAGVIRPWMRLCVELGIRCAAIFDGDKQLEFDQAVAEYLGQSAVSAFLLFKDDNRDKYERTTSGAESKQLLKAGVFRRDGVIHPENRPAFQQLIDDVRDFLDRE